MGVSRVGTSLSWVLGESMLRGKADERALRKTAYFLTALSSSIHSTTSHPPITYHPLDLSYPELHRVLGEMDEAFGEQLKDKVACIGLHGDYEAGLQFIRDGKLGTLRETREQGLLLDLALGHEMIDAGRVQSMDTKPDSALYPTSSASDSLVTPGTQSSPLPSAITDDTPSVNSSGRSWSPIGDATMPEWSSPNESEPSRPLHLVFLGSSLGNFPRDAAPKFLRSLPLRPGDTLLLGLDGRPASGCEGARKVEIAYNDPAGHTRAFEEHGWDVVRAELGLKGDAGVEFIGRYNEVLGEYKGSPSNARSPRGVLQIKGSPDTPPTYCQSRRQT